MAKQLTTDVSIRKWVIQKDNETYSCGRRSGLYVRGYISQKKCFYWRAKTWVKIGEYPDLTLASARDYVVFCKRGASIGRSLKEISETLAASHSPEEFFDKIVNGFSLQNKNSATYDDVFSDWYELKAPKLMQDGPSRRRPLSMHKKWVPNELKQKQIHLVERQDIFPFMDRMFVEAFSSAGKQLGYFRRVFEYAINIGLIRNNPVPPRIAFEVEPPKHKPHGYLEYGKMPDLWDWIEGRDHSEHTKLAMKTMMLTGHRISVVVKAKWSHMDETLGIWTIPERRDKISDGLMKSGREFQVTFPKPFFERLLKSKSDSEFVFPSPSTTGHVTANATLKGFKNYEKHITNHGFRNSLVTWGRSVGHPDYLLDFYIDHSLQGLNKSYRREDLREECAKLTNEIYQYLSGDHVQKNQK